MTTKTPMYDDTIYKQVLSHGFGQNSAGASTAFSKFVAFANLQIMSVTGALITAGTSTYTAWNGSATATAAINGDSFSVIRVVNGTAVTTATYGPFALSKYDGTATNTQTNTAGVTVNVALSGTATSGAAQSGSNTAIGGFSVNQGDTIHILRGTDATAVSAYAIEYRVQPYTPVTS